MIKNDKNSIQSLKLFIEKWVGKWLPKYGMLENEVPDFLPQPLREIYLYAGKWPNPRLDAGLYLFQGQDILMDVENLERKNGRVFFLMENQSNWTCEVEEYNNESPIYCDAAEIWDENASGHEIVCKSLSHFLVTFCLQELVLSSNYVGTVDNNIKIQEIIKSSEPLWLNGIYVSKEPTHSFYIYDNRLIIMDYNGLWYACNDEDTLCLIE